MKTTVLMFLRIVLTISGLIIFIIPFFLYISGKQTNIGTVFIGLIPAIIVLNIASLFKRRIKSITDDKWKNFSKVFDNKHSRSKSSKEINIPQSVIKKEDYFNEFKYKEKKPKEILARCPMCDRENPYGSSTCSNCGADLRGLKRCDFCFKLNKKEDRFCKNCGHDFTLS